MDDYDNYDSVDCSGLAYNDNISNNELFNEVYCDTDCYPDF